MGPPDLDQRGADTLQRPRCADVPPDAQHAGSEVTALVLSTGSTSPLRWQPPPMPAQVGGHLPASARLSRCSTLHMQRSSSSSRRGAAAKAPSHRCRYPGCPTFATAGYGTSSCSSTAAACSDSHLEGCRCVPTAQLRQLHLLPTPQAQQADVERRHDYCRRSRRRRHDLPDAHVCEVECALRWRRRVPSSRPPLQLRAAAQMAVRAQGGLTGRGACATAASGP